MQHLFTDWAPMHRIVVMKLLRFSNCFIPSTSLLKRRAASSKYGVLEEEEEGHDDSTSVKYPKQIFFIIGNEFCERFSYYGMKAVLVLYFSRQLGWTEDVSTVVFHAFAMACYFCPIIGAIIADSWLGKFKTILYVSMLYALGNALLAIASIGSSLEKPLAMMALALIAFGTGGIKPCVSAFGGDQFVLPQQQQQLVQFFSIFYFSINAGSMLSTIVTPMLRSDVSCFERETCFFAAFGVPSLLFLLAIVFFVVGKPMYKMVPPDGENLLVRFCKCLYVAVREKFRHRNSGMSKENLVDYAEGFYEKSFVADVKAALRVLVLYLPLPFFWTLYDQTGSRWTFQCTRMNGHIGSFVIKPDQMQAINPILILAFIPLFDRVIYPIMDKCGILRKPLQRMVVGGLLAAVAFGMSGILQVELEKTYARLPKSGISHVSIVNAMGCPVTVTTSPELSAEPFVLEPFGQRSIEDVQPNGLQQNIMFTFSNGDTCSSDIKPTGDASANVTYTPLDKKAHSIVVYVDPDDNSKLKPSEMDLEDKSKMENGHPKARVYYNVPSNTPEDCQEINMKAGKDEETNFKIKVIPTGSTTYEHLEPSPYTVTFCGKTSASHPSFMLGGVYDVIVQQLSTDGTLYVSSIVVTSPNEIHMLWIVPQYIVITAGEIMFSITGLEFSFSQAPLTMKSILQSFWLMTTAVGNLLVIIIGTAHFFSSQANEFFLFAGLMVLDMIAFAIMAYLYVPYQPVETLTLETFEKEYDEEEAK